MNSLVQDLPNHFHIHGLIVLINPITSAETSNIMAFAFGKATREEGRVSLNLMYVMIDRFITAALFFDNKRWPDQENAQVQNVNGRERIMELDIQGCFYKHFESTFF